MGTISRLDAFAVGLVLSVGCQANAPPFEWRANVNQRGALVDSAIAATYLATLLEPHAPNADNPQIGQFITPYDTSPLTKHSLVELARTTSTDFAALYFYQRMTQQNLDLQRRFAAYTASPVALTDKLTNGIVVVFVPGLFYQSHPETKGDLVEAEHVVRELGLATDRVHTMDAGSVEENAAMVVEFIAGYPNKQARLVMVSASKGGPEVLYALGRLTREDSARVVGWVSIGGVLRGSPLADEWLTVPKRWGATALGLVMGFSPDLLASLSTRTSLVRLGSTVLPPHLVIVHYVGVPLSGTVSDAVRSGYEDLNSLGPNDGITLLSDQLLPSGRVVVDLGLDHRFVHPRIAQKTAALTRLVLELLPDAGAAP